MMYPQLKEGKKNEIQYQDTGYSSEYLLHAPDPDLTLVHLSVQVRYVGMHKLRIRYSAVINLKNKCFSSV